MKKVIPATTTHHCDKCSQEVTQFHSHGSVNFIGYDMLGRAVGGSKKKFELCHRCTRVLEDFFTEGAQ